MRKFAFLLICVLGTVARAQDPGALVQDAISKQKAGDLDGAVREYQEFLKDHPDVGPIRANLGAALAGLGRYEEAIKEYKLALKLAPSTPGLSMNRALASYKMGRLDEASALLPTPPKPAHPITNPTPLL